MQESHENVYYNSATKENSHILSFVPKSEIRKKINTRKLPDLQYNYDK